MLLKKVYQIMSAVFIFSCLAVCLYVPFSEAQTVLQSEKKLPDVIEQEAALVHFVHLKNDTLNPITAKHIINAIDQADKEHSQCLIIKLNSPGGLLSSTRKVIKKIIHSKTPIIIYIGPKYFNAKAEGSSLFLAYSGHVLAMTSDAMIGSTEPLHLLKEPALKSQEWIEIANMTDHIEFLNQASILPTTDEIKNRQPFKESLTITDNDSTIFLNTISHYRTRNNEWAIQSAFKGSSVNAVTAINENIIDVIAEHDMDLLAQIDGLSITVAGTPRILKTKNAAIEDIEMTFNQRLLNALANPNIAYSLLLLGLYLILFEIIRPGFGAPGILGSIFLTLALYSSQALSLNFIGLGALFLGIFLISIELFAPHIGFFAFGGLILTIFGSLFLFDTTEPIMQLSTHIIFSFGLATMLITIFILRSHSKNKHAQIKSRKYDVMGDIGEAYTDITPSTRGKVLIRNKLWNAVSDKEIREGQDVEVIEVNRHILFVRPINLDFKEKAEIQISPDNTQKNTIPKNNLNKDDQ